MWSKRRWCLAVHAAAVLLCATGSARAFPSLFVSSYANGCMDMPKRPYGGHQAPQPDPSMTFTFTAAANRPVLALCPGVRYTVQLSYPQPRLALLEVSGGSLDRADPSCPGQVYQNDRTLPVRQLAAGLLVPCDLAGSTLTVQATSAQSPISPYFQASSKLGVLRVSDGQCKDLATTCAPVDSQFAASGRNLSMPPSDPGGGIAISTPVVAGAAPNSSDPLSETFAGTSVPLVNPATNYTATFNGTGGILFGSDGNTIEPVAPAVLPSAAPASLEPGSDFSADSGDAVATISLRPVLQGNAQLWQFLHAGLMLAAFCLLSPLAALLARHKWLFASTEERKPEASWYYLHIGLQLASVLSIITGFIIALLAFGWKTLPMFSLYAPHKIIGIVVVGMAVVQVCISLFRPALGSTHRPLWNALHMNWGRLLLLLGITNVILGVLLLHGLKGQSLKYWLVPVMSCLGALAVAALLLEAFKMQMQRTHRYHPKTHTLNPIMAAHKFSKRRANDRRPGDGGPVQLQASIPSAYHHAPSQDSGGSGSQEDGVYVAIAAQPSGNSFLANGHHSNGFQQQQGLRNGAQGVGHAAVPGPVTHLHQVV